LQKYGEETSQEMCTLNITGMRDGQKLIRIVSCDRHSKFVLCNQCADYYSAWISVIL